MEPERELALFRFLTELNAHIERARNAPRAFRIAGRMTREFFDADSACVARLDRDGSTLILEYVTPAELSWDEALLVDYLAGKRPAMRSDTLLWPLVRKERTWGVLAVRRANAFSRGDLNTIRKIAQATSRGVRRFDRLRIAEVASRIDRKMMEQLRPKDLFYQILHGLRSLTDYDHSAALLTHEREDEIEVVAEQIAWKKSKSDRVGLKLRLDPHTRALLAQDEVYGFEREAGVWREWSGRPIGELADLLDYNQSTSGGREKSVICAPLATRDGFLGVLKIASRENHAFGDYEVGLVRRFLPRAAVAIRNLKRTESLEIGMLEAEKKTAMASLARGVSHDINNALGAVLPLVQTMLAELRDGEVDRETILQDLEQIEASMQVCRRIFSGMLGFAHTSARTVGQGNVRRAVESTLAILDESMRRHCIDVDCDVRDSLPAVCGTQGDLEQLVLNLASNARDAMPDGGRLSIRAGVREDGVEISIQDTGCGIASDDLARVQEPFFTTKPKGNGLGLSICRSIVWNMGGRLSIANDPDGGVRATLVLPATTKEES